MAVRVYARGSQVQQHRRRGGSGADDAGWERGWSGYKSVSAPRPMTKESGRRQSRDVGSRRPREGEDDARWARRKGGGGADKDSAEQKASQEGRGKDEGWRRRVSGFEALGLGNETARALEIEGLGRPTRYEIPSYGCGCTGATTTHVDRYFYCHLYQHLISGGCICMPLANRCAFALFVFSC